MEVSDSIHTWHLEGWFPILPNVACELVLLAVTSAGHPNALSDHQVLGVIRPIDLMVMVPLPRILCFEAGPMV